MASVVSLARKNTQPDCRLISSNGNIYSISTEPAKRGVNTTGRGFWVGKLRTDKNNPDIDNPSAVPVNMHIDFTDEEEEALDDDLTPEESLASGVFGHNLAEGLSGKSACKSVLTIGSLKVDLLLQNPEELSEELLVKSAATLKFLVDSGVNDRERALLAAHAQRIAKALDSIITARDNVAKAILTKPSEEKESKPEKFKHKKSQETKVNKKGKVAYKYPKKNNGKGVNSDGVKVEQQGGQQENVPEEEPMVTPPPPIDAKPFADAVGVKVEKLIKFAEKTDRTKFVAFFTSNEKLIKKLKLTPAFLGRLHDSINTPPENANNVQQPNAYANAPTQGPGVATPGSKPLAVGKHAATPLTAKSIVVFTGATLNKATLAMIDMLKSRKARTVSDISKCLRDHFACTNQEALSRTTTILNRWERKGLVSLYPNN